MSKLEFEVLQEISNLLKIFNGFHAGFEFSIQSLFWLWGHLDLYGSSIPWACRTSSRWPTPAFTGFSALLCRLWGQTNQDFFAILFTQSHANCAWMLVTSRSSWWWFSLFHNEPEPSRSRFFAAQSTAQTISWWSIDRSKVHWALSIFWSKNFHAFCWPDNLRIGKMLNFWAPESIKEEIVKNEILNDNLRKIEICASKHKLRTPTN